METFCRHKAVILSANWTSTHTASLNLLGEPFPRRFWLGEMKRWHQQQIRVIWYDRQLGVPCLHSTISRVDATALATALVATHSYRPASSLSSPTIVRFPPAIVALLFSDNSPSTCSSNCQYSTLSVCKVQFASSDCYFRTNKFIRFCVICCTQIAPRLVQSKRIKKTSCFLLDFFRFLLQLLSTTRIKTTTTAIESTVSYEKKMCLCCWPLTARGRQPARRPLASLRCSSLTLCLRDIDLPSQRLLRGGSTSVTDGYVWQKFPSVLLLS